MKRTKKVLALALALMLAVSMLPSAALAAEPNTPKEEVVYVGLNSDGSVSEINVVNIFDLAEAGQIVDYGNYKSLRNMTTTDEIYYKDNTVTINADAGQLYYEGELVNTEMPWNIGITYSMDGKEYSAEEIAGKSGALKIAIKITENTKCEGTFFDGFALQASMALDTKTCTNIVAEGATMANVGSEKQMTYIILPGQGAEFEVTADVKNFTMAGISINGIPLSLELDIDSSVFTGQINALINAIAQLDNGASSLKSGVSELKDGAEEALRDGAEQLISGAAELDSGIQTLNNGIMQMQTALNTLNSNSSALVNGSAQYANGLALLQSALDNVAVTSADISALLEAAEVIKNAVDQYVNYANSLKAAISTEGYNAALSGSGISADALKQGNNNAAAAVQSAIAALNAQIEALAAEGRDTAALSQQVAALQSVASQLTANNSLIDTTYGYLNTQNKEITSMLARAAFLQTYYNEVYAEINRVVGALGNATQGMDTLVNAVNTLVNEYAKVNSGIGDYTAAVAEIVSAYQKIADGSAQLAANSGKLTDGTEELSAGITEVVSAIKKIYNGTSSLKSGTSTVRSETSGINYKISNQIKDLVDELTGGKLEICSFVSEDNVNVDSVQFVITTDGVQLAAADEAVEEEPEELSFWQKLLALFGL